jgi:hypothetical protein
MVGNRQRVEFSATNYSGGRLPMPCALLRNILPPSMRRCDENAGSVNKSYYTCHSRSFSATCNTHGSTADDAVCLLLHFALICTSRCGG